MKKWILITSVFLVLLIGLLFAVPILFEDKIVALVKKEVNKNINATVDFQGYDLSLFRSFPNFSLTLDSLSVDGAEPFEGVRLLAVDRLQLTIDIMSVFKGENIQIIDFQLKRPVLDLQVLSDGKANWDITLPEDQDTTTQEDAQIVFTHLHRYAIQNGSLKYSDTSSGMVLQMQNLNHDGKGDFGASQFSLITTTQVDTMDFWMDGIQYLRQAVADAKFDLQVDMDKFRFTLSDNLFHLNGLEFGINGFVAMPGDDVELALDLHAPKTDFRSIFSLIPGVYKKEFEGVKTKGTATLEGNLRGVYSEMQKLYPAFSFKVGVTNGSFAYPEMPASMENIHLNLGLRSEGKNEYDDLIIDIQNGGFSIDGQPIQFAFHLSQPFSDPRLDASISGLFDLAKIKQVYPLDTGYNLSGVLKADAALKGLLSDVQNARYNQFQASGSISLTDLLLKTPDIPRQISIPSLNANITPAKVDLGNFSLNYGDSDMALKGYLGNYLGYFLADESITGNFDLVSNRLDLNDLKQDFSNESAASEESEGVILLPAGVDISIHGKIQQLFFDKLKISQVSGDVRLVDQTASMKNVLMDIMGGQLKLNGTYDTRNPSQPSVDFDMQINGWDIQEAARSFVTIEKLAPIAHSCTGRFNSRVSIKTGLNEQMMPLFDSFNGSGDLFTKNVYIEKFKPLNDLAAQLKISRLAKQTIQDLSMYFNIKDGKFTVEPYAFQLGNAKAVAAGYTSLDQDIYYKINLDLPRSEFGADANMMIDKLAKEASLLGIQVDPLKTVRLDIVIEGKITSPVFTIKWSEQGGNPLKNLREDLEAQLRLKAEEVKKQAIEKVDSVRKEVEVKVKENVEEVKKRAQEELDRRADQLEAEARRQADRLRAEAKNTAAAIRREGQNAASKIEAEASNPLQKAGAKLAADKIRKEAEANALKVEQEAEKRAVQLENEAKEKADRLRRGEDLPGG
jgi:hypothetical protein